MAPNTTDTSSVLRPAVLIGGLALTWLLGDDPRTIRTKTGEKRTVVELREPGTTQRVARHLARWRGRQPAAAVDRHAGLMRVESVRSGRGRGELVATVARQALAAASTRAGEAS